MEETANAIYQNISFIECYAPQYVIILSGDQICKQDYSGFLRFHKGKHAEFCVAVMEVPREADMEVLDPEHSGMDYVSLIVRKNYHSLMDHLGYGREWDLTRKNRD